MASGEPIPELEKLLQEAYGPKDGRGLQLKYFVLNPWKKTPYGEASRKALKAYATAIEGENLNLANDITAWLSTIDTWMKYHKEE